jgi:hypothetical protein
MGCFGGGSAFLVFGRHFGGYDLVMTTDLGLG